MSHQAHPKRIRRVALPPRHQNFIGGKWVAPVDGGYFDNVQPDHRQDRMPDRRFAGRRYSARARRGAEGEGRLGQCRAGQAGRRLSNKIADRMEENLKVLAAVETISNCKLIREQPPSPTSRSPSITSATSRPASAPRKDRSARSMTTRSPTIITSRSAWSGRSSRLSKLPILMAVWKLAPALAAGNCIVLKPAEQTPMSIMVLMDLVGDLLPPGVLNVVNGFGVEAGKPLAQNKRIAKIAFTGETTTGRLIMQYASENLIPVTLELGGKSPNIFFADVMAKDEPSSTRRSKASPCSR